MRKVRGSILYMNTIAHQLFSALRPSISPRKHIPRAPVYICITNAPSGCSMIPLWTIPMAIATGNTLILKPSERDPGAAMIIAELCKRAGLPDGVLTVVHGGVPIVNAICDHPAIKAISFVGGDRAGRHIYERCEPLCHKFLSIADLPIQGSQSRQASTGGHLFVIKFAFCAQAISLRPIWVPRTMPFSCQMVSTGHLVFSVRC